ncbi:MAG: transcriptional repressor [Candidatus Cloacimonadota bacterium]|nr:MAG: transcriptional repressor [Candidatus Cloacimonadota bacterium]
MDLKDYLKKKGLKLTKQREKIITHFLNKDKHFSAEELYNAMKKRMPGVGYATVYRTLNLLVRAGLATKISFGENITRFEPLHRNEHHDHMVCIGCGKIVEFKHPKIERLQKEVARRYNFYTQSHALELYGYCKKCRKKNISKEKK